MIKNNFKSNEALESQICEDNVKLKLKFQVNTNE